MEQLGVVVGFVVTLMIFSYILGDNFLYRLAVYTFVGLSAAFVALITWDAITPWLESTLIEGVREGSIEGMLFGSIPLVLTVLLLYKTSPRIGGFGNLAIAFIVAVGTAVALSGALTGSLIPLTLSTGAGLSSVVDVIVVFVGVITSLLYFQYLGRRTPDGATQRPLPLRLPALIGEGFIVVTLGALYATAILTSLTIFGERVAFLLNGG